MKGSMNRITKLFALASLVTAFAIPSIASAQGVGSANIQKIFTDIRETKDLESKLKEKDDLFKAKQQEANTRLTSLRQSRDQFKAGSVRDPGGFAQVWKHSELFRSLREPEAAGACSSCGSYDACQGGCMAAKFFTGLPLDGPDPECVHGHGEALLAAGRGHAAPAPSSDHSQPVRFTRRLATPQPA